jgi:Family of unknown function (DUF5681)
MKKQNSGISAEGRTPPPAESRFRKGRSGYPAGRPRGSISLSGLTRKVALKRHIVPIGGKPRRLTTLELLILKLNGMAASGHPGAARLINWLRSQTGPSEVESAEGGFLLVPAPITPEEFAAAEEARNAGKLEPGTFVDVKTEEFLKAVCGEASPLGEALHSFHKKYGAGPAL